MRFQIGKIYETSSICDHTCIYSFEVIARTEKTVTLKDRKDGEVYRRKVAWFPDSGERCKPYGVYSMAPTIRADREVKT